MNRNYKTSFQINTILKDKIKKKIYTTMTKYDIKKQMTAHFAPWREPNVKAWERKDGRGKKRKMGHQSQTTTPPSPHTTSGIRYHRDNSNDIKKGCLCSLVVATCARPSAITFIAY